MRIPRCDDLARFDRIAIAHRDDCAVRDLVTLALSTEFVDHTELTGTRHGDPVALLVMHGLQVVQRVAPLPLASTEFAAAARDAAPPMWNVRIVSCVPGSPIDCAAMTPNRLAEIDAMATGKIASVALRANAVARAAGDRRTHFDLIDALLLEQLHQPLIEQRAGIGDDCIAARLQHVFSYDPARVLARQGPRQRHRPRRSDSS